MPAITDHDHGQTLSTALCPVHHPSGSPSYAMPQATTAGRLTVRIADVGCAKPVIFANDCSVVGAAIKANVASG